MFHSGQPSTFQIPEEEQVGSSRSRSRICMTEAEKKEKRRRAAADKRSRETPEQTETRRLQDAKRKALKKANETPEQTLARRGRNTANQAAIRNNQTPEERQNANTQKRTARNAKKTHVDYKDATKTEDILKGNFNVASLHETEDRIGLMTVECPNCQGKHLAAAALLEKYPFHPTQSLQISFSSCGMEMMKEAKFSESSHGP